MLLLVISTLLKIVFVLVVLLSFAPVLVWAERRQSSMIQDRVGPHKAGIPLPAALADLIRGPAAAGAKAVMYLSLVLALASFGYGLLLSASPPLFDEPVGWLNSPSVFYWTSVVFALVGVVHWMLAWVVKNLVDHRNQLTAFGLLHPLSDAVKMIWKEDFTPPRADKFLYSVAPIIATIPAFATFAVIPFGPDLQWGTADDPFKWLFAVVPAGTAVENPIPLQVARINVGILYMFAIAGTGIVGAAIAGYSSDNKYSLLGGLRAASQMVSYEVTLGLTLVGCFMVYNTLLLDEMVAWQAENVWGVFVQPLALILFFFASIAEMKRVPFDAPEGESEIVAGYFLEYSGMKFGMFMMGEFIEHVVSSAVIVTLFFGGFHLPFLQADGLHLPWGDLHIPMVHSAVVVIQILAFLGKVAICCFLQLQVRWTLPRFRYDQIMQLCWKLVLPLSLANILVTGVAILLLD